MKTKAAEPAVIDTTFFDTLIDDFGIWQHTDGRKPLRKEGYALDDAARGLILCVLLGRRDQANVLFDYLKSSLKDGQMYGFATARRKLFIYPSSNDAKGEAMWALGFAQHHGFRAREASDILEALRPGLDKIRSPRTMAYLLLGAIYHDKDWAKQLSRDVAVLWKDLPERWFWPESHLTYGNAIMPYALLRHAIVNEDYFCTTLGVAILEFLDEKCRSNGTLGPIGNRGWMSEADLAAPVYAQQPIDSAYMHWAYMAAYQVTDKPQYWEKAQEWLSWFEGNNVAKELLYNPENNQCFDGIDKHGVSTHSGAESNICYLLTRWVQHHRVTF